MAPSHACTAASRTQPHAQTGNTTDGLRRLACVGDSSSGLQPALSRRDGIDSAVSAVSWSAVCADAALRKHTTNTVPRELHQEHRVTAYCCVFRWCVHMTARAGPPCPMHTRCRKRATTARRTQTARKIRQQRGHESICDILDGKFAGMPQQATS